MSNAHPEISRREEIEAMALTTAQITHRTVIIGAGLAGLRVAESLRHFEYPGDIVLVGAEPHPPYDRPPLSKAVLASDVYPTPILRAFGDYGNLPAELRLGTSAVELDPQSKRVVLDDGSRLGYDVLVIATGGKPRSLSVDSSHRTRTLRTIDDATRLRAEMRSASQMVIIGGGFIGCEVASSAREVGAEAVLIEAQHAPLAGVLGREVAPLLAEVHTRHGVDLRCGVSVTAVDGDAVCLSDGDVVRAPLILAALGMCPDTGWLTGSSLAIDDGVLCDASGRASLEGVWAVGDVASWQDNASGEHRRAEHWTRATEQAHVVAADIVNAPPPRPTVSETPYFWSDQYGIKIQSFGNYAPDDDVRLLSVGDTRRPLALYSRASEMTGIVGFGVPRFVMALQPLLLERVGIDDALEHEVLDRAEDLVLSS
jgi:3-phenylpropionate/trans-cinnamate dioxygenase ferredoxin reductase subunit